LARCLYRNPGIILFDEATSALDAETESLLFNNLKDILKNVTSITVAHRLSTIEDCTRIIMMKDGKIIENGTYD
jgi:ABC-type bacteriocin/lantibiotic exporter with double-glycine peptidase domain